ncbi:MAG TPA: response regulator, partial [Bacteroidota bacterium]
MTPSPGEPVRILHLDDSPDDAVLIGHLLEIARNELPAAVTYVKNKQEYLDALARGEFDIILSDWRMPAYTGDDALVDARRLCPEIPFVMVTGEMGEDRAIETLKRGASDYVLKGNLIRLVPAIERALAEAENTRKRRRAEDELRQAKERLEVILEGAGDGLITYDKEFRFTFIGEPTAASLRRQGRDPVALLGKVLWEAFPEFPKESGEKLREAMERRHVVAFDAQYQGRWFATRCIPTSDGGLAVLAVDINWRRQAVEQMRHLNEDLERRNRELETERVKWQHLVEGIADEVWSCDLEGKMSLMNLVSNTAMRLEEFQGKTVEEIYREVDILRMDGTLRPPEEAPLLRSLKGELVRG